MKNYQVTQTVTVDCEQCLKEEQFEQAAGQHNTLPEDWIEITEGQPFNNSYQFCGTDCFIAWHKRDKYERLTEYHGRMRAKQQMREEEMYGRQA